MMQKDIWTRDFMPIQLEENVFLKYQYAPDYLVKIEKEKNHTSQIVQKRV